MHDPFEGVTSSGMITTGARRDRVTAPYLEVLDAAEEHVRDTGTDASLYVYGSVTTGMAQPPTSDVDLLAVGLTADVAGAISATLSHRFAAVCRAVEIGAAQPRDFAAETDEAYGGRVFLRHYCLHLTGPGLHSGLPEYPADVRAARGFNGDIAIHVARWQREIGQGANPPEVGRRLARKTLLAVAGLVSIHDRTWTTDRDGAAARWAEIEPTVETGLRTLVGWSRGTVSPDRASVAAAFDGVVARITSTFEQSIGLWESARQASPPDMAP